MKKQWEILSTEKYILLADKLYFEDNFSPGKT